MFDVLLLPWVAPTALGVFGLVVGSFLNVVILRHEKGERLTGRSHCMVCAHELHWYELIPVLSYLVQGRKCRRCNTTLSPEYPLVELGTAVLFTAVWLTLDPFRMIGTVSFIAALVLLHLAAWSLLMVITVYDLRTKLIPDVFSYTFAILALVALFLTPSGFVVPGIWALLSGPLYFLPFFILWAVSGGKWIGLGDGKLALGIGWLLGIAEAGTAILFAFWIGALVSLVLLGTQRLVHREGEEQERLTLKSAVPFGPFLVIGTLIVYFFGIDLFTLLI